MLPLTFNQTQNNGAPRKYEFVLDDVVSTVTGKQVTRICALINIRGTSVRAGELGGYLQDSDNLDANPETSAWVYDDAKVSEESRVRGNAAVKDRAFVGGGAIIEGNAQVRDEAEVYGLVLITENACVMERAHVYDYATVRAYSIVAGNARVFSRACIGLPYAASPRVEGSAVIFDRARIFGDVNLSGNHQIGGKGFVYSPYNFFHCEFSHRFTITPTRLLVSGVPIDMQITTQSGVCAPETLLARADSAGLMWEHVKAILTVAKTYITKHQDGSHDVWARDDSLWECQEREP